MQNKNALEWERFEELNLALQAALAPDAEVFPKHLVIDKSGRSRTFEIVVKQSIGIHQIVILVECKDYRRRVSREKVDAFCTAIADSRANKGVMVSRSGFDAGAKATAALHGIDLLTYREACDADWVKFMRPDQHIFATGVVIDKVVVHWNCAEVPALPLAEAAIHTSLGNQRDQFEEVCSLKDLVLDAARGAEDHPNGPSIRGSIGMNEAFMLHDGKAYQVTKIDFEAHFIDQVYPIRLGLANGGTLEPVVGATERAMQLTSESFNWQEVLANQEGRDITREERETLLASGVHSFDITGAKPYIRFVITHKELTEQPSQEPIE